MTKPEMRFSRSENVKKLSLLKNESGLAVVTAILVLMLVSALMAGMFAALIADTRSHATDRDQSLAYAAAHAGLEKLTARLAAQFAADFSPDADQIGDLDDLPPAIPDFEYTAPGGAPGSGYEISFTEDDCDGCPNEGNPKAFDNMDITTGPFEGFKGLITPYTLTVTARSTTGNSEVRLRRELQTVAVPVFQFGIFGEKSLGFHAGPNFDFGGRVHTNQSLYLASGDTSTLTFRDKITAFTQVVRNTLSNGVTIDLTNHEGNVSIPKVIGGAPADYRLLLATESSGTTAAPWAGWKALSEDEYKTNIRTEATGAKQLNLPLATQGATPIDLIKRPVVNSDEDTENAAVFQQRYFAQASLRILLSDRAADIADLPTVTADAPLNLAALGAAYVPQVGPPFRPPLPLSPGPEGATAALPNGLVDAATGISLTRVRDFPAAGQIRFQTAASAAGPWNSVDVPSWLRWNQLDRAGVPFTCTGFTPPVTLTGCVHVAFPINAVITITRPNGTTFTGTLNAASGANSNLVFTAGFNMVRNLAFTTSFFVGEDPVVCTGMTAAVVGPPIQTSILTGCTSPAGQVSAANGQAVNDPVYTGATTQAGTPLLNGFIKIEQRTGPATWVDVTTQILSLGFAGPNMQGTQCADPTPNAVIRLMRLRDNGLPANGCTGAAASNYGLSQAATDYWPNMLFDAREGSTRLLPITDGMSMGGLFSYIAFDAANFARWVAGAGAFAGLLGPNTINNNGYIIYFSDRRGDHDETNGDVETGEYGFEDSINPAAAVWAPGMAGRGSLQTGENFNESVDGDGVPTMQSYGETPSAVAGVVPATAVASMGFTAAQRPWTTVPLLYSGRGRLARPVLFRRALKVINGGISAANVNPLPASGITITAENPIYLQGNWNATAASVTAEPNVPTALIGDAITLLSNSFRDTLTFQFPNDQNNRDATTTGYRFAMITGKTVPFPKPGGWGVQELGSDGGVHNFMKMLEDWSGQNLRYRGSMVSLYYSRQAIGIYRADGNVYGAPTRGYNFDSDFLSPPLLPPGTPMFRDINTLKFRQILRPNQ
jgi:hypothetical protein